ncbi:MAG: hypothetical protein ACJAYU_003908 [Bradymonadia bacterium]|jgi:hypothetical protein
MEDAGMEDAGMEDAGMEDAGMEDAGMEDAGMEDAGMEDAGMVTEVQLAIQLENLEQLGDGYVYEGWLIIAGEPITTGRFSEPVGGAFTVAADDAANADAFVLTIEPEVGDDPAPSAVHVVGGDFDAGVASLSTAHGAALGTDFADVAGTFILETPTSEATEDYANGIWWLDPSAGPGASLTLPALPDGWQYEGWVAGPDGPVSTGTFTATDAADSDGAGPAAGDAGAPSFPGQDFVDPATNLVGLNAVISVEPMPDDSPAPFAIKPLVGPITDAGAGASQTQSANVDALPAGQVSVQ